jgi:hypothetical protein
MRVNGQSRRVRQCTPADYTTFMLLEDDLCPSWSALVSWARESPLLERHGFQRCFYRTEYRPKDGQLVMLVRIRRFMQDSGMRRQRYLENCAHMHVCCHAGPA